MRPIIPWIGGKRRLASFILPLFDAHEHKCYVEPFCGAAGLLFAKNPSDVEVLNDINGELVNLYRVIKHHFEELARQFKWILSSRQVFEWLKVTRPETLTDIQRAARFYYLQKHAFGAKVTGQSFGTATTSPPRLNLLRLEEDLSMAHLRLSDVLIENLAWSTYIERYDRPHTLFYCDPPYWQTEGYGVEFPFEHYERLSRMARSIQGTMIISINDHPDIRAAFGDLPVAQVPITYTVGGTGASEEVQELVYGNWRGGWPPPRPLTSQLGLE